MAFKRLFSLFGRNTKTWQYAREFIYWPFTIFTWVPAVIFFNDHVGDLVWITGPSMYPFMNGNFHQSSLRDICWVNKWHPTVGLERGMIVSFRSPADPEKCQVKRIVALEGDTVLTRTPCPLPKVQVPVNHVWVEGDNMDPTKTMDSNHYGPIPLNLMQGKITHFLLPFHKLGRVEWRKYDKQIRVIEGRRENAPGWFQEV